MTSARPYPPSAARLAAARASGHLPRAPLVGFAAALTGIVGSAFWLAEPLAGSLVRLVRAPLEAAAGGDARAAHATARTLLGEVMLALTPGVLLPVGLVLAASALVQGPGLARLGRPRGASFPVVPPSRTASLLFGLGLLLCAALAVAEALEGTSPLGILRGLGQRLVALALLCALTDAGFARARHRASLFLTRRELMDEQRAAFGAPELRAARARARRDPGAPA